MITQRNRRSLLLLAALSALLLGGCKEDPAAADLKDYATEKQPAVEGHLERIHEIEGTIAGTFGMAASTSLSQVEGDYLPALTALQKAIEANAPATEQVKAIHARYAKAAELRVQAAETLKKALAESTDAGRDIPDEPREAFSKAMAESEKELGLARVEAKDLGKKLGVKLPE
jgi:hypothetical protein